MNTVILLSILLVERCSANVTEPLEWRHTPGPYSRACIGEDLDLPWEYIPAQQDGSIETFLYNAHTGKTIISRWHNETNSLPNVVPLGNAGAILLNVFMEDAGVYRCTIARGEELLLRDETYVSILNVSTCSKDRSTKSGAVTNVHSTTTEKTLETTTVNMVSINQAYRISSIVFAVLFALLLLVVLMIMKKPRLNSFKWPWSRNTRDTARERNSVEKGLLEETDVDHMIGDISDSDSLLFNQLEYQDEMETIPRSTGVETQASFELNQYGNWNAQPVISHLGKASLLTDRQHQRLQSLSDQNDKQRCLLITFIDRHPNIEKVLNETKTVLDSTNKLQATFKKFNPGIQSEEALNKYDIVQNLHNRLKDHHSKLMTNTNRVMNEKYLNHPGFFFVTLAIFDITKTIYNRASLTSAQQSRRRVCELSSIIQSLPEGLPPRVLLCGGAGTGKTTAIQHLIDSWAKGILWNDKFDLVFHLDCQKMKQFIKVDKQMSLEDLICEFHFQDYIRKSDIKDAIFDFIADRENRILFVIDGLDEIHGLGESDNLSGLSMRSKVPIPVLLHCLIYGYSQPSSTVIATTRPTGTVQLNRMAKVFLLGGFDDDSMDECSFAVCNSNLILHKRFKEYMDAKCLPSNRFELPVHFIFTTALVCKSLGSKQVSYDLTSHTRLYIRFLLTLVQQRKERQSLFDLSSNEVVSIRSLAKLAATGVDKSKIKTVFGKHDLDMCEIDSKTIRYETVNALLQVYKHHDLTGTVISASFISVRMQEFLAALYICWSWQSRLFLKLRPDDTSIRNIQLFISGLLGDEQFGYMIFPWYKRGIGQSFQLDLFRGMIGTGENVTTLDKMHLIMCFHESRTENMNISKEIRKVVLDGETLDLSNLPGGLFPHHLSSIVYFLSMASRTLPKINVCLANCSINSFGLLTLLEEVKSIKAVIKIDLENNMLNESDHAKLDNFNERGV